jgi:hypothetical protein
MYPNLYHRLSNKTEELEENVKLHNEKRDRSLVRFIKKKKLEL